MTHICFRLMLFLLPLLIGASCSSFKKNTTTLSAQTQGFIRSEGLDFPIYFTDKIISRDEIEQKTAKNVFIIHPGHILSPDSTKEENEATLQSLTGKGINLVTLSLEDFSIARSQGISFEQYPQQFLNSSTFSINEDSIIKSENIKTYFIHDGVAIIGLSDRKIASQFEDHALFIHDYAYSIISSKRDALNFEKQNETPVRPLHSFIVVHSLGEEINEIVDRLPSNFLTSLTD